MIRRPFFMGDDFTAMPKIRQTKNALNPTMKALFMKKCMKKRFTP